MKVTKVHRVKKINEKPWMEAYIRLNTELRNKRAKMALDRSPDILRLL